MMGYSQDEAEEVVGRVLSIIGSTEHFLGQSIAVLEEVRTHVRTCCSALPLGLAWDMIHVETEQLVSTCMYMYNVCTCSVAM